MNKKFIINIGHVFGKWNVIDFYGRDKRNRKLWLCECSCEQKNRKIVSQDTLRTGRSKSCGCYNKECHKTHGKRYTKSHSAWASMKDRCTNSNNEMYKYYGGRGIKYFDKWENFEGFYEDMGECPIGLTLDRIYNNKDYYKENCRWATRQQQGRNKRNNLLINFNNETKCLSEWAELIGLNPVSLKKRINKWGIEKAILTPIFTNKVNKK